MKSLLNIAAKESYFLFNQRIYQQIDGVAMGSPLGPTFANIFMSFHEKKWLENCPTDFKPLLYRRYVDDTFLLFSDGSHIMQFLHYLNSKHQNIKLLVKPKTRTPSLFSTLRYNEQTDSIPALSTSLLTPASTPHS